MVTAVELLHVTEHKQPEVEQQTKDQVELEEDDDDDVSYSSDSEIDDALDWLDSKEDEYESIGGSSLSSWRPNAHGGHHSHSSTLQPLSNRNQRFSHHIRASPLEVPFFKTLFLLISNM